MGENFKEGEASVEDKSLSGRPSTAVTMENQAREDDMTYVDLRTTVREIVGEFGCGQCCRAHYLQPWKEKKCMPCGFY